MKPFAVVAREKMIHRWNVEADDLKGAEEKAREGCPSDNCESQEFELVSVDGMKVPTDGPVSLTFTPDEWTEIAESLRSKAFEVKRGNYGAEDKPGDDKRWISDLEALAERIETEADL